MSGIQTLATLVLGGAFDATELGENDIQPNMKLIEELQQRLVTGADDVYVELIDRAELDRVTAERDALQQRLNAADQRIDELTTRQAESRTISLSGCEFTEDELVGKAVRAVTGTSRRGTLRWVAMKDAFCVGSGVAHALCRRFGFDPDETVKP